MATRGFIEELDLEGSIQRLRIGMEGTRRYVVANVRDGVDTVAAGFRKLGSAEFKGIGPIIVYEVVNGAGWQPQDLDATENKTLLGAIEAEYDAALASERI